MTSLTTRLCSIFRTTSFNKTAILFTQCRQASFHKSPFLIDLEDVNTKYEVTRSLEDWKFVERTFPPPVIPTPIPKDKYSSEWKPQGDNFENSPYYICRTKNHMIPVYLEVTQNGHRRITVVRKIQGDIWLLEKHLRVFLQKKLVRPLRSQVNEFVGYIRFHGDHVNAIKHWMMQKDL